MAKQWLTAAGLFSTLKDLGRQALGDILLPAFEKMRGLLSQMVDVLPKAVQWFQSLSPEIKNGALAFAAVAAIAPVVVGGIALIGTALSAMLSPIGLVVTAIGGLGVACASNIGGIRDVVNSVFADLAQWFQDHKTALVELADKVKELASTYVVAMSDMAESVRKMVDDVRGSNSIQKQDWDDLFSGVGTVVRLFTNDLKEKMAINVGTFKLLLVGVRSVFDQIKLEFISLRVAWRAVTQQIRNELLILEGILKLACYRNIFSRSGGSSCAHFRRVRYAPDVQGNRRCGCRDGRQSC